MTMKFWLELIDMKDMIHVKLQNFKHEELKVLSAGWINEF